MISANAYTSPNVSAWAGTAWSPVSIAGTGTIQNIINNTGGAANSGNTRREAVQLPVNGS